jgi:hypothetical protein
VFEGWMDGWVMNDELIKTRIIEIPFPGNLLSSPNFSQVSTKSWLSCFTSPGSVYVGLMSPSRDKSSSRSLTS